MTPHPTDRSTEPRVSTERCVRPRASTERRVRPRFAASHLRRLVTAAAAGPLALLLTAAAAAAAPAETASISDAPEQINVIPDINWNTLDINSTGADIDLLNSKKPFKTGALDGEVDLALPVGQLDPQAANLFLRSADGTAGDFGDVHVLIGPATPTEGEECVPVAGSITIKEGLEFQVDKMPGGKRGTESGGDPISVTTGPVVFEPVIADAPEAFPPVNQSYTLHEPVNLYSSGGDAGQGDKIGTLESFGVVVNQSA